MRKVIARIRGGLGNQLFCYAAARRLALVNDAELVIDHITGFARDRAFGRYYLLDQFAIPARLANAPERLEPFERYRRGVSKFRARHQAYAARSYIEQEQRDFDQRLLNRKVSGTLYVDGLWQSAGYFADVADVIRRDLRVTAEFDDETRRLVTMLRGCNSVAVHVRWFDPPGGPSVHNATVDYYRRAIAKIQVLLGSPLLVLFSDDPGAALSALPSIAADCICVDSGEGRAAVIRDFWLMQNCRHFVIANSTFSWWAAWLSDSPDKQVLCPAWRLLDGRVTAWNFEGQIPTEWEQV